MTVQIYIFLFGSFYECYVLNSKLNKFNKQVSRSNCRSVLKSDRGLAQMTVTQVDEAKPDCKTVWPQW